MPSTTVKFYRQALINSLYSFITEQYIDSQIVEGYLAHRKGETNGTIAVTFDSGSILKIVSSMFGEDITELNNEIADAVGELTNMISGQARRKLEEDGKLFEAAIPSVVTGANHEITHITEGPIIAIPFHTEAGNFTIEICLES